MNKPDTYPFNSASADSGNRPMISPRRQKGRAHADATKATGVVGLSPRQWEVLQAIPRHNGMMRLYQIRLLFYPFHLDLVLHMMVHNLALARWWMQEHEASSLYSLVEYAKLLRHLNRLCDKGQKGELLTQTKDIDLWLWFEHAEHKHKADMKLLTTHRQQLQDFTTQPMMDIYVLRQHRAQLASHATRGQEITQKLMVTDHVLQVVSQQQALLHESKTLTTQQRALDKLALNLWITQAIEAQLQLPNVFASRPRYPSGSVNREVRDEVNDLIDRGLIDSYLPAGGGTACLYLSKKGRRAVSNQWGFGNKLSKVRWQPVRTYVADMLGHKTAQSNVRIAMLLAAQQAGFAINDTAWMDTPDLEERLGNVTVEVPVNIRRKNGELVTQKKSVILRLMDDFAWVDTGQGWIQPMAIEIDNGTRTIESEVSDNTIAMKYRTWALFCQTHSLQEYFENCDKGAWFLTITTQGEARLRALQQGMMNVIKKDSPRDRYFFTCLDWMHPSWKSPYAYSVFTQPIWLRGDGQELVVMDLAAQTHLQQQIREAQKDSPPKG